LRYLVRDWLSDRPPRLDITTKARGLRCRAVAIGSDNIDQGLKTPVAVGWEFPHNLHPIHKLFVSFTHVSAHTSCGPYQQLENSFVASKSMAMNVQTKFSFALRLEQLFNS